MFKLQRRIIIKFGDIERYIYPHEQYSDKAVMDLVSNLARQLETRNYTHVSDVEWIWCLVGNIVNQHVSVNGQVLHGTRQFSGGTKVYCFPPLWGDGYENIQIIGRPRRRRNLITIVSRKDFVTNWRLKKVYDGFVITEMLTKFGWDNTDDSMYRIQEMVRWLSGSGNKEQDEQLDDSNVE